MLEINGKVYFNGTPHSITLADEHGEDMHVLSSDGVISARLVEELVCEEDGIVFVATRFEGDDMSVIEKAKEAGADIIIGSIIAAQAYPEEVVSMVPCPGFERVPPAEKRMRYDKFTIFPKE